MDKKTLQVLEWPQVVSLLSDQATNAMGRDRCLAVEISTRLDEVSAALRYTTECKDLLRVTGSLPLGGILDLRAALKRASQGITLQSEELLAIANTVKAGKRLKEYLAERAEDFPALAELAEPIAGLGELAHAIAISFDASGELSDSASPELARLRHKIRDAQAKVRQTLQRIIGGQGSALQEGIVTMRGDRYVLPVRADAKGSIPGIVHDQSSTGVTLYVEPMAVVELNNALRQAQLAERDEIERILAALTEKVRAQLDPLLWNCEAYAEIDFTHAKARLSQILEGTAPRLNRDGDTRLFKARHPMLAVRPDTKVVPIDIAVGQPYTVLLITGPNTGGKTVALKTLGLVTLMTQAGLHPPVDQGSQVGVVEEIFADIGDEQSLSQNLSTFSGHMTNIIRILAEADRRTLVLLDELGAGTDPAEGAALGRAIVETLLERGSRLVATTHYGELKMMRYQHAGIQNAAVEFDLETLSPTYRLLMGVSGQSNAVAIAQRLGLTQPLIDRARELLESRATETAEVMAQVEQDRHSAAEILHRAEKARARADAMKDEYETKLAKWHDERRELEAKAKEKVEQQVRSAKGEIAAIIRELQGVKTAPAAQHANERLTKFTKPKKERNAEPPPRQEELAVGKTVFLPKLGQPGKVMSLPDRDGNLGVQVGILTVTVNRRDLTLKSGAQLVDKAQPQLRRTGTIVMPSVLPGLSCDLRGLMVHEALGEADQYLDQAYGAQFKTAMLIHGAGTGALRNALREWLKVNPVVASFRPGEAVEGGDGVTVVTLA
ncbi:MAG: recombination and strand exchange inhibitor protein [Cyanobacteria bacterium RYN_339]|nr:recombination and strand exchange inhibitor protein [Cyanobacteria bacterium RYN_339]